MKNVAIAAIICGILAGCADAPNKIQPNYVSPMQYSNLDCEQVRSEMMRVSSQVRVLVGQQQKKHKNDQVAMGVGLIVAWPALFFLIGGDKKEQLAEMKGEYEALETVGTQKKCAVIEEAKVGAAAQTAAAPMSPGAPTAAPAPTPPASGAPGSSRP